MPEGYEDRLDETRSSTPSSPDGRSTKVASAREAM